MGTAVIIVMGIICALSVPAITSNRERLQGSKTPKNRKQCDEIKEASLVPTLKP